LAPGQQRKEPVLSGLPGASLMILGTIVFVSLGSVLHDPLAMGRAAILMTPAVIITGTIMIS
jgi:hypothetical protein